MVDASAAGTPMGAGAGTTQGKPRSAGGRGAVSSAAQEPKRKAIAARPIAVPPLECRRASVILLTLDVLLVIADEMERYLPSPMQGAQVTRCTHPPPSKKYVAAADE
jgi:hypothetical protein